MRHRLLAALAFAGTALAANAARVELSATPAWQGWTRAERTTELEVRVASDAAMRATLEVAAGAQRVQATLVLQPGQTQRLSLPLGAAESVEVSLVPASGEPQRRHLRLQRSESPLLALALAAPLAAATASAAALPSPAATPSALALPGFHALQVAAADLPHQAAAYASVDALVVDAATLAALAPEQLAALLAHAAGCARVVVVVGADARLARALEGADGCGARSLMLAATPAQAAAQLEASFASPLPAPLPTAVLAALADAAPTLWSRIAVAVALYLAAALLAALFVTAWPAAALLALLATVAALTLPRVLPADTQTVIWSEGESGARAARYQARERVIGAAPMELSLAIPPQLAAAARPCETAPTMRLAFDPAEGRLASASFATRLFGQASLCFSGSFPLARSIGAEPGRAGAFTVRNSGIAAWPRGWWLAEGRVHELPALAPGAAVAMPAGGAPEPVRASTLPGAAGGRAAERAALERVPQGGGAALWPLDLAGVAALPPGARGWLLVTAAAAP